MKIFRLSIFSVVGLLLFSACTEQLPSKNAPKSSIAVGARVNGINAINAIPSNPAYIMRDAQGNLIRPNGVNTAATTPVRIKAGHLQPSHVRGARIYDDFMIELAGAGGATMPAGDNPLALLGTATDPANAPSGMAAWLCSGCHGYDYEGGVFEYNGGATDNLLELRDVRGWDEAYVYNTLAGGFMAWDGTAAIMVHDYTGILTEQAITDVSDFVVNEIFDTHAYIRAPTGEGLGDEVEGMDLYNSVAAGAIPPYITVDGANFNCVDCHGADKISGPAALDLVTMSWTNPSRWLHRTLFGSPRSLATYPGFVNDPAVMPGLYEVILTDGLHFGGPEQGGAVMHFIQM